MSHFYGKVQGNRGEATRCGTKKSGLSSITASWQGSVYVHSFVHEDTNGEPEDWVVVSLEPWQGSGNIIPLYRGPISGRDAEMFIQNGGER